VIQSRRSSTATPALTLFGPEQYTEANTVIALALATSLVREAHQQIEDAAGAATV
jgi:hypothetical protein